MEYLNSGDWIENLTALEYNNKEWSMYKYDANDYKNATNENEDGLVLMENEQIFEQMLGGFLQTEASATSLNFK